MESVYYSHYREEDQVWQSNEEHQRNVAKLAVEYCPLSELKGAAFLAGLLHDSGKNTDEWGAYLKSAVESGKRGGTKLDHSTLGGLLADCYAPGSILSEMLQTAIYMHHGLQDCVSMADGIALIDKRRRRHSSEEVKEAKAEVELQYKDMQMPELFRRARQDLGRLLAHLQNFAKKEGGLYGNRDFYLGFCEKLLFSSLMDADWRDTADFMEGVRTTTGMNQDQVQEIWRKGMENLEARLNRFDKASRLSRSRREISDRCKNAALSDRRLFRLAVPTGAGKTLASLRFALHCAAVHKKRHIFYVAPFKSILEQNAEVIRDSLNDMPEVVLEHHGDVVIERQEEDERYRRLTENWDEVPVIVTTAVQFFQTIFKEKRSNVRRFHSLCDSVIILDEVQAVPVRMLQLFNLAVNFLTEFCNTTVVLCTATQPLLDRMAKNSMLAPVDMTGSISEFEEAFRRVEYHDCTEESVTGFSAAQAAGFIGEKAGEFGQVLAIFNTRASARQVYENLKGQVDGSLYYLSTWMCARHRSDRLEEIREKISAGERVVCISTQLVEAGVDFSFRCVIRSLAGLDSLIQAAGRCNRNGAPEMGQVYLIRMSGEAENVSSLPDIRKAQEAMRSLLEAYRRNPMEMGGRLDSEQAVKQFYLRYLGKRMGETAYSVRPEGVDTNLVELLSDNPKFAESKKIILNQAFESAGKAFEVIEEDGGTDVLVFYGEGKELIQRLQEEGTAEAKRSLLRRLQRYSVSLSKRMLQTLGNAVYTIEDQTVMVLEERYYDGETGVREEPGEMPFLAC